MDGGRPPRVPTWVLATAVSLALLGAAVLFARTSTVDRSSQESAAPAERRADEESVDGVLQIPDEDEEGGKGDGPSRRDETGRDRLRLGADGVQATDAPAQDDDETEAVELPPVASNLAGVRVALAAASSSADVDAARKVKVGALRVPCSPELDVDRLAVELALLDRVAALLQQADAQVVRISRESEDAPCIDVRVTKLDTATFALVVRANPDGSDRVLAARNAAGGGAKAHADSVALANEVSGAIDLDGATVAANDDDRALLGEVGAIDADGDAAIALADLGGIGRDVSSERLDELALQLVTGLATAASRAD